MLPDGSGWSFHSFQLGCKYSKTNSLFSSRIAVSIPFSQAANAPMGATVYEKLPQFPFLLVRLQIKRRYPRGSPLGSVSIPFSQAANETDPKVLQHKYPVSIPFSQAANLWLIISKTAQRGIVSIPFSQAANEFLKVPAQGWNISFHSFQLGCKYTK